MKPLTGKQRLWCVEEVRVAALSSMTDGDTVYDPVHGAYFKRVGIKLVPVRYNEAENIQRGETLAQLFVQHPSWKHPSRTQIGALVAQQIVGAILQHKVLTEERLREILIEKNLNAGARELVLAMRSFDVNQVRVFSYQVKGDERYRYGEKYSMPVHNIYLAPDVVIASRGKVVTFKDSFGIEFFNLETKQRIVSYTLTAGAQYAPI